VYEHLVRHFSEKFGMEAVPFPHEVKDSKPVVDYPQNNLGESQF
jgi:hypothetical protein